MVHTDLDPDRHLNFTLEIPVIRPVTRGIVMAGKIELASHTGSIRIQVSGTEPVRVRVSASIVVRVTLIERG